MISVEFKSRHDEMLNFEYFSFSLNFDVAFKFIETSLGEFHVTDEFEKEAMAPFSD